VPAPASLAPTASWMDAQRFPPLGFGFSGIYLAEFGSEPS
jgi:hypothetical protein